MLNGTWKVPAAGGTVRIFSTISLPNGDPPIPRVFVNVHVQVTILAGTKAAIHFNRAPGNTLDFKNRVSVDSRANNVENIDIVLPAGAANGTYQIEMV